jgi:hypothetical protein
MALSLQPCFNCAQPSGQQLIAPSRATQGGDSRLQSSVLDGGFSLPSLFRGASYPTNFLVEQDFASDLAGDRTLWCRRSEDRQIWLYADMMSPVSWTPKARPNLPSDGPFSWSWRSRDPEKPAWRKPGGLFSSPPGTGQAARAQND